MKVILYFFINIQKEIKRKTFQDEARKSCKSFFMLKSSSSQMAAWSHHGAIR